MYINVTNVVATQYLISVLSIVSFLCAFFFIYVYIFTKSPEKFYLKLVLYLQISDAIQAVGLFMCIFEAQNQSNSLCLFQAFLTQFGCVLSMLWRAAISIIMTISVKKSAETAEAQEIRLLLLIFWLSLFISIIPFCSHDYGYDGKFFCWFRGDISEKRQELLIYFLFYFELWISLIIILVNTVLVVNHLKNEARKSTLVKFRNKLKYYPLVVIAIWLIPSIDRIVISSYGETTVFSRVFAYFHIIALSLQGFANFFLYGYDHIKTLTKKKKKEEQKSLITATWRQQMCTKLVTIQNEEEEKSNELEDSHRLTENLIDN